MVNRIENFYPQQNLTFAVGAGSSAAAQTITQNLNTTLNSTPLQDIRIYNAATGVAFIDWGGTGVVATTTTGFPVGAGLTEKISMGRSAVGITAILGTGTGNVYIAVGQGS
jgi:hypothetical protein